MADLLIPTDLLPLDGRFGCGPSKIRREQLDHLLGFGTGVLGTSHRQAPVKDLVARVRAGLGELFRIPDGYEVVLGNGGSTAFWDAAAFSLIEKRAQNLVFGEFGGKFAKAAAAPWLEAPDVIKAATGSRSDFVVRDGIDVYAWPQNETSTGVMAPVSRVTGDTGALTVIDATNVTRRDRGAWVLAARRHALPLVAIVLDLPGDAVLAQDAGRDRVVGSDVVGRHLERLRRTVDLDQLHNEGFDLVITLRSPAQAQALDIGRRPAHPSESTAVSVAKDG